MKGIVYGALFCVAISARADTIFLLNGNQMTGRILSMSADPVVLEIKGGKISFRRSEIADMEVDTNGYQGADAKPASDDSTGLGEATKELGRGLAGLRQPVAEMEHASTIADLPPPKTDEERAKRYDMAMTALNKLTMNPEEATQEEHARAGDYIKALGQLGPSVAPQIEENFRHGDVRAAGAMLGALRIADPERATALAKGALKHLHPEAREQAIAIIAASDAKDKGALLAQALDDLSPINRMAAVKALGETKDKGTAGAVLKLLNDSDPEIQTAAIAAMQAITGQKLTRPEEWQAWAAQNVAATAEATAAPQPAP